MRVLNVEVLEYLERKSAVVLLSGNGLQDLLEGVDDVGDHELVLLVDCVAVLFILLAENPAIHPLSYRYLLLLEQPQQCLDQYLAIVLGQ